MQLKRQKEWHLDFNKFVGKAFKGNHRKCVMVDH